MLTITSSTAPDSESSVTRVCRLGKGGKKLVFESNTRQCQKDDYHADHGHQVGDYVGEVLVAIGWARIPRLPRTTSGPRFEGLDLVWTSIWWWEGR